METELKSLEEKVLRLIRLHQEVQMENIKLRQQLTERNEENEKLTRKIKLAASRLETLLINIPDNEK